MTSACGGEKTDASSDELSSPIAEFLGYDTAALNDPKASEAQFIEEERARQEAIAVCMKNEGFEYTAQDPSAYVDFSSETADGLEYGSSEWTAKYGFGISTQRWPQSSLGPDLIGYDDSQTQTFDESSDPNSDYVNSLSEEEQMAYNTALYGETPEFDATVSDEETATTMSAEYEMSGCYGEAQSADNSLQTKFYQEFGPELDGLYTRAQSDPRIVEANKKVSDCVADKGLEYTDQETLYTDFEEQLSEIDSQIEYPGADLTEDDFNNMSPEELDQIFNQPFELSPEAKAKLADIQANEITLAKAVDECDGNQEEMGKLFQTVMAEYEQQFLDDNADKLADLKANAAS